MRARQHVVALLSSVFVLAGAAALACDPAATEPPPSSPKRSLPPDRTEVTMEVSSASPPGEVAPPASAMVSADAPTAAPASSAAPAAPEAGTSDEASSGGAQTDPLVEKAVAPLRPRLRACYNKAVAADPSLGAGSATFDATVGKDGRAVSVRFARRDGLDQEMVGCLLTVVKAMTFDPSRKTQIVSLSFGAAPAAASAADAGAAADVKK